MRSARMRCMMSKVNVEFNDKGEDAWLNQLRRRKNETKKHYSCFSR